MKLRTSAAAWIASALLALCCAPLLLAEDFLSTAVFELERCVPGKRLPPEGCTFEPLVLSPTGRRDLRKLMLEAHERGEREQRQAEREGYATGGVWGFVNFGHRMTFTANDETEQAWIHATPDAGWIDGDGEVGNIVFTEEESARLWTILGGATSPTAEAVKRLPIDAPWKLALRVDLNCDGVEDHVFVAEDRAHYYVAVVPGPADDHSAATYVAFRRAGDAQDALCGEPAGLQIEDLDFDIVEMLGDEPQGWQRSASCKGLSLSSGDCDSHHLFWNHARNKIAWWRL